MKDNDNYKLSTWGNLWNYLGISRHANYGFYWLNLKARLSDVKDWMLYYMFLKSHKVPLIGESPEDYYSRKIYSTSYDCFNRPITGPPGRIITIRLREEQEIENWTHLVLSQDGKTKEAINFGSYNYLGFGGYHPIASEAIIETLKDKGVINTGFAVEREISNEQKELESRIAEFLHKEDAIVVPMGFATNSTLLPILLGENDLVFSDKLNHSSSIIGLKSSKAEKRIFKHNDIMDLKKQLDLIRKTGLKYGQQPNKIIVVVEGLYSMEGEYLKLKELIQLKKSYGFYIYIDEAHSIGALGETGRGIVEHLGCDFNDVDVLMGTFSKSFAAAGGYIAADKDTIALLKSNCYSYVYGSSISPVEAKQIISCLDLILSEEGKRRISQLRKNSIIFRKKLKDAGCHVLGNEDSPVVPVMCYHSGKIKDLSRSCLKQGVAIVVVGYPACNKDQCRIRFCISASHTDEDINKTVEVTVNAMKETGCIYGSTPIPKFIYQAPSIPKDFFIKIEENKEDFVKRHMQPLYESSDNRKLRIPPRPVKGLDLVSYDIYNYSKNPERLEKMISTIRTYGCGSCGPRAFYGTTMEHLNLEEKLMSFFRVNDAIIYSYGSNTMTSVIQAYSGKGNYILVDECCNYPIQLGCRISKSKTVKFKHNDIEDFTKKYYKIQMDILDTNKKILIVTEGVFQCDLSISPLKEMAMLKESNAYLVVDDSLGVGVIGESLKGSVEYHELSMDDVDMVCGSLEFVFGTVGGFVVGKYSVIDKQRLFGVGYIFSASAPPFTCTAGSFAFDDLEKNGSKYRNIILERRKMFKDIVGDKVGNIEVIGNELVPFVLLNCERNKDLCEMLYNEGFYTCVQQHLDEDWCQHNYVRVNLVSDFDETMMKKMKKVLMEF